jgi:quercetin dioxygenase-like cupin family protein
MKPFKTILFASMIVVCTHLQAASNSEQSATEPSIVLASEVEWEQLNPARGDKSPKAGTLWGDRKGSVATGFLVKFVDGFSSPPHIHNVSYRGVVISGLIHNDDPDAASMWMPAGSFWTQPKGEVHITAANGETNVAYIEIEEGPYLVWSKEKTFHTQEISVNVDASNIVWLDASTTTWIEPSDNTANQAKIAFLWRSQQDKQLNGTLIKLPAGFTGEIHSFGSSFRAVVTQGQLQYQTSNDVKTLQSTSYFSTEGEAVHPISSTNQDSMLYVRTDGKFKIMPTQK